jgi:HSP20 family protein
MNSVTKTEKRPASQQQQPQQPQQNNNSQGYLSPRVNITETKEGYLLEAEMPGVNKDGLEISLEGHELTFVGHRGADPVGAELVYRESSRRDYRRAFTLDPTIDVSRIEARMENGVLKLHLPKAESVKPRKIAVTE